LASSINASTTAGVVTTADTSGVLNIQTAGTTAVSISAAQVVSLTSGLAVTGALSATGTGTLRDLITTTGALIQGTSIFRVESTAAALPAGTLAGLGLEMYASSGTQKLSVYNRTTNLAGPLELLGSTFNFNAILDISNASAGQIKFPATQNASANANTLDDYEEGTWTPTDGSGAGLSLTVVSASYTKIGRLVYAWCYVNYPVTANTALAQIAGFPFVQAPVSTYAHGNARSNGVAALMQVQMTTGASDAIFFTAGGVNATNSNISNNYLVFSIVYQTT